MGFNKFYHQILMYFYEKFAKFKMSHTHFLVSSAERSHLYDNELECDSIKNLLSNLKSNICNAMASKHSYLAVSEKLERNELLEYLKIDRMPKNTVLDHNTLKKWKAIEKESSVKLMEVLQNHYLSKCEEHQEKYRSLVLKIVDYKQKIHGWRKYSALDLLKNYVKTVQKNIKYDKTSDKNKKLNRKASYRFSEELIYEKILRTSVCLYV